jgi:hypothetical protein
MGGSTWLYLGDALVWRLRSFCRHLFFAGPGCCAPPLASLAGAVSRKAWSPVNHVRYALATECQVRETRPGPENCLQPDPRRYT